MNEKSERIKKKAKRLAKKVIKRESKMNENKYACMRYYHSKWNAMRYLIIWKGKVICSKWDKTILYYLLCLPFQNKLSRVIWTLRSRFWHSVVIAIRPKKWVVGSSQEIQKINPNTMFHHQTSLKTKQIFTILLNTYVEWFHSFPCEAVRNAIGTCHYGERNRRLKLCWNIS